MSADTVNHPPHYVAHPSGVECIDIAEHLSFSLGNALKYVWRAEHKGRKEEDLKKALWYIRREIRLVALLGAPDTFPVFPVKLNAAKVVDAEDEGTTLCAFLSFLIDGIGEDDSYDRLLDLVEELLVNAIEAL